MRSGAAKAVVVDVEQGAKPGIGSTAQTSIQHRALDGIGIIHVRFVRRRPQPRGEARQRLRSEGIVKEQHGRRVERALRRRIGVVQGDAVVKRIRPAHAFELLLRGGAERLRDLVAMQLFKTIREVIERPAEAAAQIEEAPRT